MNYRAIFLTIFPISITALLSLERLLTYLVGLWPSSAALWRASLELRALFRDLSNQFDLVTGHSLLLQALSLSGLILLLCWMMRTRFWIAYSFLVNHVALLGAGVATTISMNFKVASFSVDPSAGPAGWFAADHHLTWLQLTVLALGGVSCLSCHYVFVAQARMEQAGLRLRLSEL